MQHIRLNHKHDKTHRQNGFTIIELMLTLAIVGIFSAVAIPSFSSLIQNNRMTSQTNDLVGAFHIARSEAITRNSTVRLCASQDGITCNALASLDVGWLIWTDANNDGILDNTPEEILRVGSGLSGGNTITFEDTGGNAIAIVDFSSSGLSDQQGTLTICDSRGAEYASAIVLTLSGRARSNETDIEGAALEC